MKHCIWTTEYKTWYEKIESVSGEVSYHPVQRDQFTKRDWCESCKQIVNENERQYRIIKNAYDTHIKMNHGHCWECVNCQPYEHEVDEDRDPCLPERCEICFAMPPTCIERDACPKNDIIVYQKL